MAIMMGRMVCTTSRIGAAIRDLKFRLARMLGKLPDGPPAYPPISAGAVRAGSPAAGSYFPQLIANDGTRLDDVLGSDAWLINRHDCDQGRLSPFASDLLSWFDYHSAEAVLVRPDRHVFATGSADQLKLEWKTISAKELMQRQ
jgi:3-(3-hydroxy-phenyl)propionate hydroxylase